MIRLVLAATAGRELRESDTWSGVRALREHTSIARQRGIFQLGEVRVQALGLELVLESERFHCARQSDPEKQPRAPWRLGVCVSTIRTIRC